MQAAKAELSYDIERWWLRGNFSIRTTSAPVRIININASWERGPLPGEIGTALRMENPHVVDEGSCDLRSLRETETFDKPHRIVPFFLTF